MLEERQPSVPGKRTMRQTDRQQKQELDTSVRAEDWETNTLKRGRVKYCIL